MLLMGMAALHGATPVREAPVATWEKIYFRTIDYLTSQAGLTSLRTSALEPGHLEARFWFGFGIVGTRGLMLQRANGQWTSTEIWEGVSHEKARTSPVPLGGAGEELWRKLADKRLLTLPDFKSLPQSGYGSLDGTCVVVETVADGKYRTIMYPNPSSYDNAECRELESLVATLTHELKKGDGTVRARRFLTSMEIRILASKIFSLKFPMQEVDFLKALQIDLNARDLKSDGISSDSGVSFQEWPLTSRAEPRGHFALVAYYEPDRRDSVRQADIIFHDRALEQSLVLQPEEFPARRH